MFCKFALLIGLITAFHPTMAIATCRATMFADDWNGDLMTVNEVNSFCSDRATWWKIDPKKYQQKDYCFSKKEERTDSNGRIYYAYPTSFWYQLKSFSANSNDEALMAMHVYARNFAFQGWPASIRIIFDPQCS